MEENCKTFLRKLKELLPFFTDKVYSLKPAEHGKLEEVSSFLQILDRDFQEGQQEADDERTAKFLRENNVEAEWIESLTHMFRLAHESRPIEMEDEENNIGRLIVDNIANGNLWNYLRRQNENIKRKIHELNPRYYGDSPNNVSDIGRNEENQNKRRRLFED